MSDNPYLELLGMMRDYEPTSDLFFAFVKTPFPNLTIITKDTILDKDDFLISKSLLDKSINELSVGDKLLVLNINDEFIVIDKVVSI